MPPTTFTRPPPQPRPPSLTSTKHNVDQTKKNRGRYALNQITFFYQTTKLLLRHLNLFDMVYVNRVTPFLFRSVKTKMPFKFELTMPVTGNHLQKKLLGLKD